RPRTIAAPCRRCHRGEADLRVLSTALDSLLDPAKRLTQQAQRGAVVEPDPASALPRRQGVVTSWVHGQAPPVEQHLRWVVAEPGTTQIQPGQVAGLPGIRPTQSASSARVVSKCARSSLIQPPSSVQAAMLAATPGTEARRRSYCGTAAVT